MTTQYHLYADDGFESAHRSLVAAIRRAKHGWKTRHVAYRVVECGTKDYTTGGETPVFSVGTPRDY